MRCVSSSYFSLGDGLYCVTGLRCESNFVFKPVVALVSIEEAIFNAEEWIKFTQLQYDLNRYFLQGLTILEDNQTNKQILFNHKKTEIVIKCPTTYNTVKINKLQYLRIFELNIIIMKNLKKLQEKMDYLNFQMTHIIQQLTKSLKEKQGEMMSLCENVKNYLYMDPRIKDSEIEDAIQKLDIGNQLIQEALIIYNKELKEALVEDDMSSIERYLEN